MSTTASLTLSRIRRALLWTLLLGIAGTATELLLIGHVEDTAQWVPLALLGVGFMVALAQIVGPSRLGVRTLQVLMALFVAAGALGVALHYRGNREFELEMYPTMTGLELVEKVVTGATPVLAPGAMTLLGLVGLLHTYRYSEWSE